ncbi:MAG: hypothetical protein IT371_29785 [Deltaproteobacteria bacterium]|nr:hypothetical protein [Deltaproteobacteria bacterium]
MRGKCVEGGSGCPSRGEYDGVAIVGEIRDAVAVTGCRLGDGKPVAYTEDRAEEHAREVVISAPGCANPSASLNLSTVFGLDVSAKVSSTTTGTSPTVVVPQNRFWTAYRQTVRLHRFATLWNGSRYVGYASVTDWRYDKVIATGNQCPVPSPLPAKWLSTEKLCLLAKMNCTCP